MKTYQPFFLSLMTLSSIVVIAPPAKAATLRIKNVRVANLSPTSATILWETNLPSNTWVFYGTTPQYGKAASLNQEAVTSHKIRLEGLTSGTVYHYQVRSTEILNGFYGKTAISSDRTWTSPSSPTPSPSPSPTATTSPTPTPSSSAQPSPSPTTSPSPSPSTIHLGMTSQDWDVIYDGYGQVSFDATQGIILQPQAATSPDVTHAALILSRAFRLNPITNFEASIRVSTEQQLRTPTPKPWEVFWLFFNYSSDSMTSDGNKQTNYFLFKPNGIELGKAYGSIGQTYLYTGTDPKYLIGSIYTLRVRKEGAKVQVWIDNQLVLSFAGTIDPNTLYDSPGTFGLYTEDARVHIYSVDITPL